MELTQWFGQEENYVLDIKKENGCMEKYKTTIKFAKTHRPLKDDFVKVMHLFKGCLIYIQSSTKEAKKLELKKILHELVDEL